jgi:AAA family ATP:ADP antiporter
MPRPRAAPLAGPAVPEGRMAPGRWAKLVAAEAIVEPIRAFLRDLRARPAAEKAAVRWAFLWFFCLLAFNYAMRPIRDAFGARGPTADRIGLFIATFAAMTVFVPAWAFVVSRLPRRIFVPLAHQVAAASLLVFFLLHDARGGLGRGAGHAFFVWQAVTNVFLVSVFWSTLADLFREQEGRLHFGLIAAGGTLGGIAGSAVVSIFGARAELGVFFLGGAGLLQVGVFAMGRLVRAARGAAAQGDSEGRIPEAREAPPAPTALAGLRTLSRSPRLVGLALYIFLGTVLATIVYLLRPRYLQASGLAEGEQRALLAQTSLVTQLLASALQAGAAGPVLRRTGVGPPLLILPLAYGIALPLFAMAPSLGFIILLEIATRGLAFGLAGPAKEVVFTSVTRAEKYQAKALIDNWVYRGGDLLGALLFGVLEVLGLLSMALASIGFAGLALLAARTVSRDIRRHGPGERSAPRPHPESPA